MFGLKKKKAAQPTITVWDGDGATLYAGRLAALEMREETVRSLSVRFFNDPEPCEIHRAAVRSRAFAELEEALGDGAAMSLDELGELRVYLSAYPAARRVRLTLG